MSEMLMKNICYTCVLLFSQLALFCLPAIEPGHSCGFVVIESALHLAVFVTKSKRSVADRLFSSVYQNCVYYFLKNS